MNIPEIIGVSQRMQRIFDAVRQVAPTDATVLIQGETGTGKELIANAIHRLSARSRGPMVRLNCAAIPESLLASELFGHERGAFTGAVERRKGRFEQAHGGTIFLDEIGDLTRETQVMVLRVLQEREIERLGSGGSIHVDVRVIAATNRDLEEDVRRDRFRRDLFYRLNVFPIQVPPLRERPEDIPALVEHFARKHASRIGRRIEHVDRRTLEYFRNCEWQGNIRELENAVERAVILSHDGTLRFAVETDAPVIDSGERDAIELALRESRGRISGDRGAARRLGLPASTLEFRIRRLGINKHRYRSPALDLQIVSA
jgi:formate hydrogenlyase transcriptional activator